ncbi:hypothetical protein LIER_16420 [Lithospermum erythrorhizon]|uniref:RNase H type-1 domain-containing protein n=1 Tax=Lithospermum erythrorhizon TaxID=34254 RepID=A0AAV3Q844_LITER
MKPPESYKDVQKLTDGAKNSKRSAAGLLIYGPNGIEMEDALPFSFEATNNETEYEAMVAGLELVRSLGVRYHAKSTSLAKDFTRIIVEHIPSIENEEADRLSKLVTTYYDELPNEVYVEVRDRRAYKETPTKVVLEEHQDWRTDIAKFLQEGLLLADSIEARKIQQRNLVGKLPKAKGSAKYVVVPVDYFSKWEEAAMLAKIKGEDMVRFSWKQVINRFGIPRILGERSPILCGRPSVKLYSASHPKDVNKLNPKWEGPYCVSRVLGPGTYELEEMDGKPVPRTWHSSKLSKFYC